MADRVPEVRFADPRLEYATAKDAATGLLDMMAVCALWRRYVTFGTGLREISRPIVTISN
jgi:hypothetical protein